MPPPPPATTGPTEYIVKCQFLWILFLLCHSCLNILMRTFILPLYSILQTKHIQGVLFLTLITAVWPYLYLFLDKKYRTMSRFDRRDPYYCVWAYRVLILDCFVLVLLSAVRLFVDLDAYPLQLGDSFPLLLLIPSIPIYFIQHHFETFSYKPLEDCEDYIFKKQEEIKSSETIKLSILESSPFSIKILFGESSTEFFDGPLIVQRKVFWWTGASEQIKKEEVIFKFHPFLPLTGNQLTLIPETHSQKGSYNISGFRAFGRNRGNLVLTRVFLENGTELAKLVEEYNREGDPSCKNIEKMVNEEPNWSKKTMLIV